MYIYEGIVLIASCKSHEKHLEHGVSYKVGEITDEDDDQHQYEMIAVADDNQECGESFLMTTADLGKNAPLLRHHVFQQPGPHHQWAAAICADIKQELRTTSSNSWPG